MSDSIEDLAKDYKKNVDETEHPRSIGLFTIPEYPELEAERGMWSAALDAILTTLRYLAPATLITLFWGQQSFLFKILKHIDSAFRAIVFSSDEQKQEVLQWLAESGAVRVEHLETVWRHGWILCSVLDAALPGACAGHPPTRLTLKHAQAIADHYLGVEPVFSRQELEANDSLSRHQEWKLATYLDRVRQALSKLTPPVSKPVSQRTSPETSQFTLDYVAKGSGLSAAQVHNRAYFKIYPTAQQTLDPGQITVLIRGPKDTYGMAVLPPVLGKAQMIRQKLLGLQSKQNFTDNILPITQGATYLRSYGKNDMNKTYYIPKTKYDIDINVEIGTDHAKICYTVNIEGKYEVSITSRSLNIVGSPFAMTASNDIVSILEKDTFCLEDGEEIDIVDVKTDRKVVLRIVDFVTEKMLLKENGTLEKISDDEAKMLMTTDNTENEIINFDSEPRDITKEETPMNDYRNKFNTVAQKILAMNRVCKVFNDLMDEKQMQSVKKEYLIPRGQQDIPDIVNSTLSEVNVNPYVLPENRDKYIVPESISVSLRTEKSKHLDDEEVLNTVDKIYKAEISVPAELSELDNSNSLQSDSYEDQIDDNISIDRMTPSSTSNPFLNDMYEDNFVPPKNFGTFVTSEYERNNFQNEETRESSIAIVIDHATTTPIPQNNNPFIDADMLEFERPKTPVYKIISGEKLNRDETGYIHPKSESKSEEALANEFVNPFFMHHLQSNQHEQTLVTDFIIGAPVSLPPLIRAPSPEPVMKSLIMTENENLKTYETQDDILQNVKVVEPCESVFSTPVHTNLNVPNDNKKDHNSTESSTFHSLESNLTNNSNASTSSDNQFEEYHVSDQNLTPRKDMWDSAYVSIDDNNSSPDSNNNESTTLTETPSKQKFSSSDDNNGLKKEEISNMGPAEKELWQTCNELTCATNKNLEDVKPYKWDVKRSMFTPIIEESDRSISSGAKDMLGSDVSMKHETETISVAFAELNDMYQEYFPNSEISSTTVANEDNKLHSMKVNYVIETEDDRVDSASELSDVKRHEKDLEGETSEVQANVTESVSVSQTLRSDNDVFEYNTQNKDETQFGDSTHSNLVLEKKIYWDERIREIEAKSAETPTLQKKKRIYSKQLKHNDSLSKRRGKQMIKNFLCAGGYTQLRNNSEFDKNLEVKSTEIISKEPDIQPHTAKQMMSGEKLVGKWKKYWDTKLESDHEVIESPLTRNKSPKNISNTTAPQPINQAINRIEISKDDGNGESLTNNQPQPVKQEIPEEVFKAFETSPKRFFGTCRKHILNKIDTFSGKPVPVDKSPANVSNICRESGLVSSRISLFHNMSNTEELPWAKRKCQSLHDIYRTESEKGVSFVNEKIRAEQSKSTQPVIIRESESNRDRFNEEVSESVSLKNKRARMIHNQSSDEVECQKVIQDEKPTKMNQYFKETINEINDENQSKEFKGEILRKKSFSKSELDIFNKVPNEDDYYIDKYKSCDELPKINVKSFISLYESVSKHAVEPIPVKRIQRTTSVDSQTIFQNVSTTSDAVHKSKAVSKAEDPSTSGSVSKDTTPGVTPTKRWFSKDTKSVSNASFETETWDSIDIDIISRDNKQTRYLSLSDIELEIIETGPDKSTESSPEITTESAHIDYKSRFKTAKEYFQSLEELREPNVGKPRKLNECELLLRKQSTESLENERPQKRVKKNIKSHSLPSSEISKIWNQLQESQDNKDTKLVKISEKFNVEDLFADVTEGKLSRQGSLRGIPHKKAVLEAFRSMENVADTNINSYEIAESQSTDFAKEYRVKHAQTYLTEYPYLPMTDPSKYHSRLDTKASGLISFKELLGKKPRRNSVPDLRLNTKFTEDL